MVDGRSSASPAVLNWTFEFKVFLALALKNCKKVCISREDVSVLRNGSVTDMHLLEKSSTAFGTYSLRGQDGTSEAFCLLGSTHKTRQINPDTRCSGEQFCTGHLPAGFEHQSTTQARATLRVRAAFYVFCEAVSHSCQETNGNQPKETAATHRDATETQVGSLSRDCQPQRC